MKTGICYKAAVLIAAILLSISPYARAKPVTDVTIIELAGNFWRLDIVVADGGVLVEGASVLCSSENAFISPKGNSFKTAGTDYEGRAYMVIEGQDGVNYSEGWVFEVFDCAAGSSDCFYISTPGLEGVYADTTCCCEFEGASNPYGIGCNTLTCSDDMMQHCEGSLGGVYIGNAKCNYSAGDCEKYVLITIGKFEATAGNGKVGISWSTESEVDNAGFNLYRSENAGGEYEKINDSLIPAEGSPTEGAEYEFIDEDVKNRKTYYYKLEDIDLNGISTIHGPLSVTPRLIYGIITKNPGTNPGTL